jgi:putative membrane protein
LTELENQPRTIKGYLRLFLTGIAMGAADVVPGVSGGTMAFILGIYEELLQAIKSFDLHLAKLLLRFRFREALEHIPWQFLVVLLSGIGIAILSLAHAVSWLLDNEPVYLFAFFFGLVLASIVAVAGSLQWQPMTIGMLIVGTVVAYVIVGLVPLDMPHDPVTVFVSGMIAITAMILPGISGSFMLLILNQYDYILEAVKTLDILGLLPLMVGMVVGITGFARVLSWLLKRYHQATIAVLVGFMIGSLRRIWPWKEVIATRVDRHGDIVPLIQHNIVPNLLSGEFFFAVGLCIFGFLLICFLDHLQSHANPVLRLFGIGKKPSSVSSLG